ncbi:MAG: regulatory protein RecX [Smithella sp.]|nr:regulatory protein RecX [Smithellaceae bacterium]NLA41124.1 regulatory protein RecX [Smithella sp.]
MKALDPEAARHKAYQLLSLRPHSERELEKKLLGKGFAKTIVKEALEKLHELKYLNDASFANGRARYLATGKLWGNRKIAACLREKGVDDFLIDDAITAARRELSEEEAIVLWLKKKVSKGQPDRKEKQKIFQSLMGRGFPPGLILTILRKPAEEEADGENG